MVQKKFSKDPKVKLVSLEDFLEHSDYLSDAKKHLWKEGKKPDCGLYYKITPRLLILIDYTWTTKNLGMDFSEKLDYIEWVRGLKHRHRHQTRQVYRSHPMWVRGLKH